MIQDHNSQGNGGKAYEQIYETEIGEKMYWSNVAVCNGNYPYACYKSTGTGNDVSKEN